MRTIKFRFWSKITKTMSPPVELSQMVKDWVRLGRSEAIDFHIPMLFTGLLDKNNKEVYSGDIIRAVSKHDDYDTTFEVKWGDEGGYLMSEDMGGDYIPLLGNKDFIIEILGNIYENPKLLK